MCQILGEIFVEVSVWKAALRYGIIMMHINGVRKTRETFQNEICQKSWLARQEAIFEVVRSGMPAHVCRENLFDLAMQGTYAQF